MKNPNEEAPPAPEGRLQESKTFTSLVSQTRVNCEFIFSLKALCINYAHDLKNWFGHANNTFAHAVRGNSDPPKYINNCY